MIEVQDLTKVFGARVAVESVSFTAPRGAVTALLGPNGSGKSTTIKCVLGLVRTTSGHAWIDGKPLAAWRDPLHRVGALIEPRAFHPKRSGYHHLRSLSLTHGIDQYRVYEVIEMVGLSDVALQPAGSYSLGMAQRLGLATALLGDPTTLILDEPANGLDADGNTWFQELCRRMAGENRAVLVASHQMGEIDAIADRAVILGRGHLLANDETSAIRGGNGTFVEAYNRIVSGHSEFQAESPDAVA